MGLLVEGTWKDEGYEQDKHDGKFVRDSSTFRNWVTADGSAGPSGEGGFKAAPGRYHLYVSYACPWAHRTLIFRKLKGLEDMIGLSVVHWHMGAQGWSFEDGEGTIPDTVNGTDHLYEVYLKAKPDCSGRVTVPVLWDKDRETIVSNESSEIIRMFNSAFDGVGAKDGDYYPEPLRPEIDEVNERVYDTVNNGVYKAGFATSQDAYEEAVYPLFDSFEWLERRLMTQRYLAGEVLTEADWRLFTTMVRFDSVYYSHFKCNIRPLSDYKALWGHTRELYQMDGIADTVVMDHIKRHYYGSQRSVNPTGIVPVGPDLDFMEPHGRDILTARRVA